MRISLQLCPTDFEKVKRIYTAYHPEPAEWTDIEVEALLMWLLDHQHAKVISRAASEKFERCGMV